MSSALLEPARQSSTAFDLVMFDLDGTLIETAAEICDAVNDTLRHAVLPGAVGIAPARALFVGDLSVDVATARIAGVAVWALLPV